MQPAAMGNHLTPFALALLIGMTTTAAAQTTPPRPVITQSKIAVGAFDVDSAAKAFCDEAVARGGSDIALSNCQPRAVNGQAPEVPAQLAKCQVLTMADDPKQAGTTLVTLRCVNTAAITAAAEREVAAGPAKD
jgi:hypothetical protein